jgi:phosphatidylinositol alpha-1,6-mannosyltransferase
MSYQNIALIKRLMFHILQNATKVVAISDYNQEKLVRLGVSSDKIVKIMPKIDLDEFRQRPDCHDLVTKYNLHNKKVVLSVNRLVERKGNDVMIKAFRKVKEKHANAVYVIVGSGAYKKCLEDLVLVSHLHNEIIFVDSASDQEVIKFLYICDVFVMLSREIKEKGDAEGFGIVFLEANACHKPVIGGKSGGVPDAIIDGQTGLLVDPLDINAISQAVLKLLGDPSYAAQLGEAGYDRVKNQFDWREGIYQMKKTGLFDS